MAPLAAPSSVVYRRRRPEESDLYRCIANNLRPFLARVAAAERSLPRFVGDEIEGYLDCGRLDRGFARFRCSAAQCSATAAAFETLRLASVPAVVIETS